MISPEWIVTTDLASTGQLTHPMLRVLPPHRTSVRFHSPAGGIHTTFCLQCRILSARRVFAWIRGI